MNKSRWIYWTIFFIIVSTVFFLNSFLNKKESFEILPSEVVNNIYTWIYSKSAPRRDFFIVSGYDNYEKNIIQIDSFICSKSLEIDSILRKDGNYDITILRRSKITNDVHLKAWPGDFEEHSLYFDVICRYEWKNYRFLGRYAGWLGFKYTPIDCNVFR